MQQNHWKMTLTVFAGLLAVTGIMAPHQTEAQRSRKMTKTTKPAKMDARAANLALVSDFEKAYKARNSFRMLRVLMVPSTDQAVLDRRLMWQRGHGSNDAPGTHPVLFASFYGSFSPRTYSVMSAKPIDNTHWDIAVREEGNYRDEDGRYNVVRVRHFKTTYTKDKWYVMDYVMLENTEKYGFFVDDIVDKVTKIG